MNMPAEEEGSDETETEKTPFNPDKTDRFQNSYMDNVLFMKGYYGVKTNPRVIEKWTKQLNKLQMKLSDSAVEDFVSKEADLVRELGNLRAEIDGSHPSEGLDEMRKAEEEGVKKLKVILNGDLNYQRIRSAEKKFIENLK